jgi:hypothetical protein
MFQDPEECIRLGGGRKEVSGRRASLAKIVKIGGRGVLAEIRADRIGDLDAEILQKRLNQATG